MANTEDLKSSEETPLAGSSPASGITYNDLTRNPNQTLDGKTYMTKMIVVKVYRYVILRVPKGTQELEIRKQAINLFNKIPNEEALFTYDYVNEYESQSNEANSK